LTSKPYLRENKSKSNYRDSTVLMYQILSTIKKCNELYTSTKINRHLAKSTKILYSTEISLPQFKNYISFLLDTGLITRTKISAQKGETYYYEITEKAKRYMKLIENIKVLFNKDSKHFIFPEDLNRID
jgi:predicted transcriptional regulator